jgi:hypothetical protein
MKFLKALSVTIFNKIVGMLTPGEKVEYQTALKKLVNPPDPKRGRRKQLKETPARKLDALREVKQEDFFKRSNLQDCL